MMFLVSALALSRSIAWLLVFQSHKNLSQNPNMSFKTSMGVMLAVKKSYESQQISRNLLSYQTKDQNIDSLFQSITVIDP